MVILLYGSIAEKAGASEIELEAVSVAQLRQMLNTRIRGLPDMRYAIAVDRMIVTDDRDLCGTEEIAVLPPFAGG